MEHGKRHSRAKGDDLETPDYHSRRRLCDRHHPALSASAPTNSASPDRSEEDKRIEFEEMLVLGAMMVMSILYLGWRRVRAQKREIRRRIAAERHAHELARTIRSPAWPTGASSRRAEGRLAAPPRRGGGPRGADDRPQRLQAGQRRLRPRRGRRGADRGAARAADGRCATATWWRGSAATSSPCWRHTSPAPEAATGMALRIIEALSAPIDAAAASTGRRRDRHRPARRRTATTARGNAAQGRHRPLSRQGRAARPCASSRRRWTRMCASATDGARAARRHRHRQPSALLPAADRPEDRRDRRLRGPGALDAPGARRDRRRTASSPSPRTAA